MLWQDSVRLSIEPAVRFSVVFLTIALGSPAIPAHASCSLESASLPLGALDSLITGTSAAFAASPDINPLLGLSENERNDKREACEALQRTWTQNALVGGDIEKFKKAHAEYTNQDCGPFLDAHYTERIGSTRERLLATSPAWKRWTKELTVSRESDPKNLDRILKEIDSWKDCPPRIRSAARKFALDAYPKMTKWAGGDAEERKVIFQIEPADQGLRMRWWDKRSRTSTFDVTLHERGIFFSFPVDLNPRRKR